MDLSPCKQLVLLSPQEALLILGTMHLTSTFYHPLPLHQLVLLFRYVTLYLKAYI